MASPTKLEHLLLRSQTAAAWTLLVSGIVGFIVTFPLWLTNHISDRQMLGLTLVLSWAALWYAGYLAVMASIEKRRKG